MSMTKDQKTLLLYLETRLVDHSGRVDGCHINTQDIHQANSWNDTGFIGFGRIASEDCNRYGNLWVTFSDEAWVAAHRERRAHSKRILNERNYKTTAEKYESHNKHGCS